MTNKVQFIRLKEDDRNLIVSFAIDNGAMGVKSLVLLRTLFHREVLADAEKGVKVSMQGESFSKEYLNNLSSIRIGKDEIEIKSTFREYTVDISGIPGSEMDQMIKLLKKQNFDGRFIIQIV